MSDDAPPPQPLLNYVEQSPQRRPLVMWIILFAAWIVGLAIWAAYLAMIGWLLYKILK